MATNWYEEWRILSDKIADSVPRSRYNAQEAELRALEQKHEKVVASATAEIERLQSKLQAALVFVDYIAKRYEQGWDDPVTERFYNEAKALLPESPR